MAYAVRTPVRIVGENVQMGHRERAPRGTHDGYETWLVQGERRVVRVNDDVVHPAAAREDGRFYAYLAAPTARSSGWCAWATAAPSSTRCPGGRPSSGRAPTWSVSSSGTAA